MQHPYLAVLISLALLLSNARSGAYAQSGVSTPPLSPQAEKIKQQTTKLGVGNKATVIMLDKTEYYGAIKSIEADGFLLWEMDTKQLIEFKYGDVKKVRKGYGRVNHITGKRVNPRTDLIVGAAVLGGLILLIGLTVGGDR